MELRKEDIRQSTREGEGIKINNVNFIPKRYLLNEAMTNMGYKPNETIMEGIDNSFDNGAKNIQIHFWEERFQEFRANSDKSNTAIRYAYLICDDGKGIKNIEDVFEYRSEETVTYSSKEEYMTKNGRFHFGDFSHLNVGDEVSFYTKTSRNKEWLGCTLKYDRLKNCPYISDVKFMSNSVKELILAAGIKISNESGAILFVRGIHKNAIFEDLEAFELNLVNELGVTYHDYLIKRHESTNENVYSIKVENVKVAPINPLCEISNDELIKPKVFGEYTITLDEVFNKQCDRIDEYQIIEKFSGIFDEQELRDLEIHVRLVAINPNFSNPKMKAKIKKKFPDLSDIYFPSPSYSGVYIKRNNRYVGRALGMLGIVRNHMSHTKFRGEIYFSPVFDQFFTIQADKNRNNLSEIISELIQEKILGDSNLKGGTVAMRIINAINSVTASGEIEQLYLDDKSKIEDKRKTLLRRAGKLKERLEKYYQDTEKIDDIISKTKNIDSSDLEKLEELVAQVHSEYMQNHDKIYKDIDYLIDRVKAKRRKRVLSIDDAAEKIVLDFLENIKEPCTEGELYGIFCLVQPLWPEVFGFKTIGYHTRDGVDLIVDIPEELFEEFNFNIRFGRLFDKVKDSIGDERYTFVELKLNLPRNMNHSLDLVSHIICWQKPSFNEMYAIGGMYSFSDSSKKLLVSETGNKVKVIYLKEVIEKNTGGKFKMN